MFGYVSQSDFDHEHALRLAAERAQATAEREAETLRAACAELRAFLAAEQQQQQDLLDRFLPKAEQSAPASAEPAKFTAEDVRGVRAFGKADMIYRNITADRLEQEEREEQTEQDTKRRHNLLTAEEKRNVSQVVRGVMDDLLGIYQPEQTAEAE